MTRKPHDSNDANAANAANAANDASGGNDAKGDPRKSTSIAEARDRLPSLVHEVEGGAPVEITRRGRPVAVLVAYQEYQRLLGEGPSFWDAMLAYRSATHLDDPQALGIDADNAFPRDKSPGRSAPFAD